MKVPKVSISKFFRPRKSQSQDSNSEKSSSTRSTSSVSSTEEAAEFTESQTHANESPQVLGSDVASTSEPARYKQRSATGDVPLDSAHEELVDAFNILDKNSDGKISAEELGTVLRSLGEDMPEDYLRDMVNAADVNRDGHVDLEEFLELNKLACEEVARSGELRDAFSIFDLNKDEFISEDELHHVLNQLGQQWFTREDCTRMIKAVDADGDGKVDFGEFKTMMSGTRIF